MPATRLLPLLLLAVLLAALLARSLSGAADPGLVVRSVTVHVVDRVFHPEDGDGPPVRLARRLVLEGEGFVGTSFGPGVEVQLDDGRAVAAPLVLQPDARSLEAWIPEGFAGGATLVVTNGDRTTASRRVQL